MYKFFFIIHACTGKRKRKRFLGCARDDDTERAVPFLFIPLREPASAPFGAPPSGGRREYAAFSHRHFERKREIFFVCGQAKEARMTDHGKHRTLCGVESRCFMQTALRRKTETANEKDPSTAFGMTIRERAVSHSLSSRGGSEPPPLRTASFQGKGGSMPPSRIVISSESEKSFSFAVRQKRRG